MLVISSALLTPLSGDYYSYVCPNCKNTLVVEEGITLTRVEEDNFECRCPNCNTLCYLTLSKQEKEVTENV